MPVGEAFELAAAGVGAAIAARPGSARSPVGLTPEPRLAASEPVVTAWSLVVLRAGPDKLRLAIGIEQVGNRNLREGRERSPGQRLIGEVRPGPEQQYVAVSAAQMSSAERK